MKIIQLIVCLLFLSPVYTYGQIKDEMEKVNTDYFNSIPKLSDHNAFVVKDIAKIDYNYFAYSSLALGARDDTFRMKLKRTLRIMVNNSGSFNHIIFLGDSLNINSSINKTLNIVIYTNNNNRIQKLKIKTKNLNLINNINQISIDLNSIDVPNNSLIDISYEVDVLNKVTFNYLFQYKLLVLESLLILNIPEIYNYKIENNISEYSDLETYLEVDKGILIGYKRFSTFLQSPHSYEIDKWNNPSIEGTPVYCKINKTTFQFTDFNPNNVPVENRMEVRLNLIEVNKIGN